MTEVISVRFRGGTKNYYFDPKGLTVAPGTDVVVETAQGASYATCVQGNHQVEDESVVQPLCPVMRLATENDRRTMEYNHKREKEAGEICRRKIAEHGLEMKLVNVSCNFDGNKIIFFFTADGRVDFRELVKDLASIFRARIELRQIGVRDEAKMLGGIGICGRPFCCSQFLGGFLPVSIKMAKTQNLSLNPTKISGTCGRLMCCLKYEQEAYEDAARRCPKQDSFVQTPDGPGNVTAVNLLKETVKVHLDGQTDNAPHVYHNCEICVLRNGKGSREGIEIPEERPARYVEENQEETFQTVTSPLLEMLQDEDPPYRVKMGADSEDNKPRRRRSRGGRRRSGSKGGEPLPLEPEPKERGEKADKAERGENRDGNRPARNNHRSGKPKSAQAPKKPAEERPAPVREGAEAAAQTPKEGGGRRRPHHRGGRRRNRGGGDKGGAAPKAE